VLAKVGYKIPTLFSGPPLKFDEATGHFMSTGSYVNLPAVVIVFIITLVLIKGISESAGFNALMVAIKVAAVLFVIGVGAFYVDPANWTNNFAPFGYGGVSFFCGEEKPPAAGSASSASKNSPSGRSSAAGPQASSPGQPSSSSPTSVSTRSRPTRRKPRTPSATCPSASSLRFSSAPSSTSQ